MPPEYVVADQPNNNGFAGGVALPAGSIPAGSTCHCVLFMPTARKSNPTDNAQQRQNDVCFMKGYAEKVEMKSSTSSPWVWRRLVFTLKGDEIRDALGPAQLHSPGNSYQRRMYLASDGSTTGNNVQAALWNEIFEGSPGSDWLDVITAKTSTKYVTFISDKTVILRSGNDSGFVTHRRVYYPFNKNLVYDDKEVGSFATPNYYSTDGKPGMGDAYVVDLFQPQGTDVDSGILNVQMHATLYWHEK